MRNKKQSAPECSCSATNSTTTASSW